MNLTTLPWLRTHGKRSEFRHGFLRIHYLKMCVCVCACVCQMCIPRFFVEKMVLNVLHALSSIPLPRGDEIFPDFKYPASHKMRLGFKSVQLKKSTHVTNGISSPEGRLVYAAKKLKDLTS